MAIPDGILRKPGPLNDDEKQIMRKHCEIGYNMLIRIPFLRDAAEIVLSHQEFFDGTGYPRSLKGEEIPLGARIFAVADALDTMISDQPYRRALPLSHAREEIRRCSGAQFDPKVVEVFFSLPESLWVELRKNLRAPFRLGQLKAVWHPISQEQKWLENSFPRVRSGREPPDRRNISRFSITASRYSTPLTELD